MSDLQQINGHATAEQLLARLARRTRAERNFERTLAALALANDPRWCLDNAHVIDAVRRGALRRHGEKVDE